MKKIIKEFLPYLLILIGVILVKTYIVAPVQVNGSSMYTTLHDNDVMLLNKLAYLFGDVKRFDIVVLDYEGIHLIKRVIALPGEEIEVKDNKLYINGKYIKEKFLDSNALTENFSYKVPKNHYFVMGDNRMNSRDSRIFGFVSKDNIEGVASLTIFPLNRIGFKK